MERVLRNVDSTITYHYSVDGVDTDPSPDSATVTITRADGTVVDTDAATNNAGTGIFTYDLAAADAADLDTLTFAWEIDGQVFETVVEVVGGFYFSIAQALALTELEDFSAAEIATARTLAEQAFEDAARVAFVPRYAYERVSAQRGQLLSLPRFPLRVVRSVTEITSFGGDPADVDASGYSATEEGIYRLYGWTPGPKNVTVGYEYGYDRPPELVARAVLILAKNWLIEGPITDRATAISAGPDGGTITLLTPGVRGVVFGIPVVDSALEQYGRKPPRFASVAVTAPENAYLGYDPSEIGWS